MKTDAIDRAPRGVFLFYAIVLTASLAGAQISTGTLSLTVRDEQTLALPGVSILVKAVDTGQARSATSSSSGSAVIEGLAPGAYAITLKLSGFADVEQSLILRVGQTVTLHATMRTSFSQKVTVDEELPLVDVYRTDSSVNIIPEQIERLPVPDRNIERLAFIAPGVQRERGGFRFIENAPVIGSVGNASETAYFIDGVDLTDPSLGLARVRFSQDAVREFRVIHSGFDAEIGNSTGSAVSIVTKSGTNQLAGSLFGFFRDDSLRATGALELGEKTYNRQQFGATIGGPIVHDRTFFFASIEQIGEDDIAPFRPAGAFSSRREDIARPTDQTLSFLRLDHTLNDSRHLSIRFAYERSRLDNFRVGGAADESYGQDLNRDGWNLTGEHTWVMSTDQLNELRVQVGRRKFDEPTNSDAVTEWFSSGATLQTGRNALGHIRDQQRVVALSDTHHWRLSAGPGEHDFKVGGAWMHVGEDFNFDIYGGKGAFIYATDDRSLPILYLYGEGDPETTVKTNLLSGFIQDDWRVHDDVTLGLGLRYDVDTGGNNPDFTHPLVPDGRDIQKDRFQPRLAMRWDVDGAGTNLVRVGAGLYSGRLLLIPALVENLSNGTTGWLQYQRLNGAIVGLTTPPLVLDPADPQHTGIARPVDISIMASQLNVPSSRQASIGWTRRLADTGLNLDVEAIYGKGRDELVIRDTNFGGNANPVRFHRQFNQVNTVTNAGRSAYKALILSVGGALRGGHLLTASYALASRKNIADDFSPELPFGYPSDPADIDGEWGRSRSDERHRVILTGMFKLPWQVTVAPIYLYGSGQPWTRLIGYDFNGDGKNSDRPAGVARNSENGPSFSQLNLRLIKSFALTERQRLELSFETFNLFNTTNYNVDSVNRFVLKSGPTLARPATPEVANPDFAKYRATLPSREAQLGLRYSF